MNKLDPVAVQDESKAVLKEVQQVSEDSLWLGDYGFYTTIEDEAMRQATRDHLDRLADDRFWFAIGNGERP